MERERERVVMCIHTYIHTYVPTYLPTYIHTYMAYIHGIHMRACCAAFWLTCSLACNWLLRVVLVASKTVLGGTVHMGVSTLFATTASTETLNGTIVGGSCCPPLPVPKVTSKIVPFRNTYRSIWLYYTDK